MPREPISKIETSTSNEIAETLEFQGAIDTGDEKTNTHSEEPNETEQIAQPPKKVPAQRPKKPVESAALTDEVAKAPKPATTRQRKKSVELVSSTSPAPETADVP